MGQRLRIEQRVAARVRAAREERGLSQQSLARRAGTSRSQVAAVERGERAPTIATLEAFSEALGIELSELVKDGRSPRPARNDTVDRIAARLRGRDSTYLRAVERLLDAIDRVPNLASPKPRPPRKKRSKS